MSVIIAALVATQAPTPAIDQRAAMTAIEAICFDYIDGQLEGNPDRVKRSLHPDLAKRAIQGETPDERLGLRRMTGEELVSLTKQGVLRTPRDQCAASSI